MRPAPRPKARCASSRRPRSSTGRSRSRGLPASRWRAEGAAWDLESLEFRAPGLAQVRTSGRITWSPDGPRFAGPAAIEAADPRALVAWLEGRAEPSAAPLAVLKASGDLTLAAGELA